MQITNNDKLIFWRVVQREFRKDEKIVRNSRWDKKNKPKFINAKWLSH